MKEVLYRVISSIALIMFILALVTVTPWSGIGMLNMIGYRSVCPAAPVSTFLLLVSSGGLYVWAAYAFRGKRIL